MSFRLVCFETDLLQTLINWFNNEDELKLWAGPSIRFPYTISTFTEDIKIKQLASFALLNDQNDFVGFGQFYNRLDHCHLGRLVIAPELRGQGVAKTLLELLMNEGKKQLKLDRYSLFVLEHNQNAIKAYKKSGFLVSQYPEDMAIGNCLYMTK